MSGFWLFSFIALWLVTVTLVIAVVALARQIGILHLRLGPVGAMTTNEGPEIGTPLPQIHELDLAGQSVDFGGASGKRKLIAFVSPACSACDGLMPGLVSTARDERETLEVVIVSLSEDMAANRAF